MASYTFHRKAEFGLAHYNEVEGMRKELYAAKEKRDARAVALKEAGATLIMKRVTGPQNIDPAYVVDGDHSMNGEYRTYFKQLYAVEWEV